MNAEKENAFELYDEIDQVLYSLVPFIIIKGGGLYSLAECSQFYLSVRQQQGN